MKPLIFFTSILGAAAYEDSLIAPLSLAQVIPIFKSREQILERLQAISLESIQKVQHISVYTTNVALYSLTFLVTFITLGGLYVFQRMFRETQDQQEQILILSREKICKEDLINDLEERIKRLTDKGNNSIASKAGIEIQRLKNELIQAEADNVELMNDHEQELKEIRLEHGQNIREFQDKISQIYAENEQSKVELKNEIFLQGNQYNQAQQEYSNKLQQLEGHKTKEMQSTLNLKIQEWVMQKQKFQEEAIQNEKNMKYEFENQLEKQKSEFEDVIDEINQKQNNIQQECELAIIASENDKQDQVASFQKKLQEQISRIMIDKSENETKQLKMETKKNDEIKIIKRRLEAENQDLKTQFEEDCKNLIRQHESRLKHMSLKVDELKNQNREIVKKENQIYLLEGTIEEVRKAGIQQRNKYVALEKQWKNSENENRENLQIINELREQLKTYVRNEIHSPERISGNPGLEKQKDMKTKIKKVNLTSDTFNKATNKDEFTPGSSAKAHRKQIIGDHCESLLQRQIGSLQSHDINQPRAQIIQDYQDVPIQNIIDETDEKHDATNLRKNGQNVIKETDSMEKTEQEINQDIRSERARPGTHQDGPSKEEQKSSAENSYYIEIPADIETQQSDYQKKMESPTAASKKKNRNKKKTNKQGSPPSVQTQRQQNRK